MKASTPSIEDTAWLRYLTGPKVGKLRKNKAALEEMHNKRIAKRRRRRFLFGRS